MGYCYASKADLWAILRGLSRAWELGYGKVVAESDYKIVLELLTGDSTNKGGQDTLVQKILFANIAELDYQIDLHFSRGKSVCGLVS